MKRQDIIVRDPYILVHNQTYYLYGTRSQTTWSDAEGFDCYVSKDLENWEGPIEVFKRDKQFFATQNFWAPEVYYYKDQFLMVTTFGAPDRNKGVYVLASSQPTGPFQLIGERLTPEQAASIDGTLYFEQDQAYLIYSHSFETSVSGDMCLVPLNDDLTAPIAEPLVLFSAPEASWAKPVPFAKAEFGIDGDVYFTDGPSVFKDADGSLYMSWSSWGTKGYAVGLSFSKTGRLTGPWEHIKTPIFSENGGHGMVFTDLEGYLRFAYHFPNDHLKEVPQFDYLNKRNGHYQLDSAASRKESLS